MPITSDRHHHYSVSRSTGHVLYVVHQRLRRANLPFLVAFFSALFMFVRALSGAGYVDPLSQPITPSTLNYSHLATDAGSLNAHGSGGFAEHWARFKEAVLSCPEDVSSGSGSSDDNGNDIAGPVGAVGDSVTDSVSVSVSVSVSESEVNGDSNREGKNVNSPASTPMPTPTPTSSRRVGVGCLKERLSGVMGLSRSRKPDTDESGPASALIAVKVEQEDKAFGISLDGIGIIGGGG